MVFHFAYTFLTAFALDLIIGDPDWLFHPVRWMGRAIIGLEPVFRKMKMPFVISGTLFAGFLVLGAFGIAFLLAVLAGFLHPACRFFIETLMIFYCISPSSLRKAALEVDQALTYSGLAKARFRLSYIVGRETKDLSETAVIRAAVETVAENLVDGFISPLFYAAIGGAPLAVAYRMVNTLDSMVGYRNDRYLFFGKASARLDDIANFIPARLSVPIISLSAQILSRSGRCAFHTAVHEGSHHASPNSGYSEAAFAGALAVRLNGPATYHGRPVNKPFIGIAFGNVVQRDIRKACDLMFLSAFLWTLLLTVISAYGSASFQIL